MAHHRNLFVGELADDVLAPSGNHCVRTCRDGAQGGAQELIAGDRVRKAEGGGDENSTRSLAHARHVRGAADDHLDASGFGGGGLVRGIRRNLRGPPAATFQGAEAGDCLAALDIAAAEIENARHQPFIFLA
jgi:hypothetical protein